MPAALTRMSGAPKVSMISVAARSMTAGSARSALMRSAAAPVALNSATVWSRGSGLPGEHYHLAPAPARALAMPLPMPELPPVTSASRPVSEKSECR